MTTASLSSEIKKLEAAINETKHKISARQLQPNDLLCTRLQELQGRYAELKKLENNKNENIAKISKIAHDQIGDQITDWTLPIPLSVKNYKKQFLQDHPDMSGCKTFCISIVYSKERKYLAPPDENYSNIEKLTESLWSELKRILRTLRDIPLSLEKVDFLIHSEFFKDYSLVILDTNLNVILTNFSFLSVVNRSVLIYDSGIFVPVPNMSRDGKHFCQECCLFKFRHDCKAHCFICRRSGVPADIGCSKTVPDAKPRICNKCKACCQTDTCWAEHRKICGRLPTMLRKDVIAIIEDVIGYNQ